MRNSVIPEKELKTRFPHAFEYLRTQRKKLEERQQFSNWYAFSAQRNLAMHDAAQILLPLLANRGLFCELPEQRHNLCLMASGGFSLTVDSRTSLSPRYLLALLNSKLLFSYLRSISNVFRGGWITCTKQYVARLPIHAIDLSNMEQRAHHDMLVGWVGAMTELNRKRRSGKLAPSELERLEREVLVTDAKIDEMVFKLYGISDEERTMIEGDNV